MRLTEEIPLAAGEFSPQDASGEMAAMAIGASLWGTANQTFDRNGTLRKRPIDADRIDRVVNSLVRQLESSGENEIPSKQIGEMVMASLLTLDQVAYVRYASVYRDFKETSDFAKFLTEEGLSDGGEEEA